MKAGKQLVDVRHDDAPHELRRSCSTTTAVTRRIRSAIRRDAIAVLQYTGGTTGLPKGAMLTHANLSAACQPVLGDRQRRRRRCWSKGEERVLAVLPLFHIYALSVNMLLGIRLRRPRWSCTRASTSRRC